MAWDDPPNFTTGVVVTEQEMDTLSNCILAGAHVEATSASAQTLESTTTETTLLSHTLPANRLGTDRELEITCRGNYRINTTAGDLELRLKFGASSLLLDITDIDASGQRTFPWEIRASVCNIGATNSQYAQLGILSPGGNSAAAGPLASGFGAHEREWRVIDNTGDTGTSGTENPLWTVDTTASVLVQLTAKWDTSSADLSFRKKYARAVVYGS